VTDRVLVNFRLESALVEDMDAAAARAGLNRTEWVRSIITMACRRELERVTTAVAVRVPPGAIDGCAHPKHLRRWDRVGLICQVCEVVLERTRQGA
jgi:hypothetical protein